MHYILDHKIAAVVVVVLIIGGAWYGFTQTSTPAAVLTTTSVDSSNPTDQDLVTTLLQLQAVSLNGAVLTDPSFLSLKDFTTQVVTEPVGRSNPFAPLSSQSLTESAASSTTSNPKLFAPRTTGK